MQCFYKDPWIGVVPLLASDLLYWNAERISSTRLVHLVFTAVVSPCVFQQHYEPVLLPTLLRECKVSPQQS